MFGPDLPLHTGIQPRAVVISDLHAECSRLLRHVAANATHPKNPEDFALGIMPQCRHVRSAPFASPKSRHAHTQVPESTQEKKYADISSGIVYGRGRVGHADAVGGAGLDIHLIVAGTIVADEAE